MPSASRNRPSQQVDLPDDVTDPLLWRLAYDVGLAHRPDESGRCGNLDCPDEIGPCPALRNAQRAMRLARGGAADPARRGTNGTGTEHDDEAAEGHLPRRLPGSALRAA